MAITKARSASHWYHTDGTPCYEVPNASKPGELRAATLKDARKLGLLPSVTTLQSEINKEQLNAWRVDQGIIAALENPTPLPGESRDDHMERIARASESVVDIARNTGTLIHAAVERFYMFGEETDDPTILPLMRPYYIWHRANVVKVHYCEKTVVSHQNGFAGKLDIKAEFVGRGVRIADIKSRKRNAQGRFIVYDENGEQLAAYLEADAELNPRADGCMSILISSDIKAPDVHIHEWPNDQLRRFWEAFKLLSKRWSILKNYEPPTAF